MSALKDNTSNATELSTVGHITLELRRKGSLNLTEMVINHGLERGIICQIVKFLFEFSSEITHTILKIYLHSMAGITIGKIGC